MNATVDLTTQTPAQIDGQLAALDFDRFVAQTRANNYARVARDEAAGRNWTRKPRLQESQAAHENAMKYQAKADEIAAQMAPLNAEFDRRGGWTRAFLVQASNGHVHSSMNCSSCFPTTEYAWMTDYSAHSEDEIVTDAGERACTICYPSAPAEVLNRPTKMFTRSEIEKQAARAEREAKRAAKEAAKVIDPTTGKVVGNTERGVNNEIMSTLDSYFWYGDHPSNPQWLAKVETLINALAARQGRDPRELSAEYFGKAEAKDLKKKAKMVKELKADPLTNWDLIGDKFRVMAGLDPIGNR